MKFCSHCGSPVNLAIPEGDNRPRHVCTSGDCGIIHYQNPNIVAGCLIEHGESLLLCKRAIEPRYGYWTVPAGFMELGESQAEGAARETLEEACAKVEIGHLFASVDVIDAGQVHLFFTARLLSDFAPGDESLEVRLFDREQIPWDDIAFQSGHYALQKYFEDRGQNNGVHIHELRRAMS